MNSFEKIKILLEWRVSKIRDWFARWIYAQHNARVLSDMEWRFICVLSEATGGMMSKAYYDIDTMTAEIARNVSTQWSEGYLEGRRDVCVELGVEDPTPHESEVA